VPTPEQLDALTPVLRARSSARDLVAAIIETDAYRADEWRLLHSEQLYTSLADALGWDPGEDLDADLRVLSGGTDDLMVLQRNERPSVGLLAVQAWAGRRAGGSLSSPPADARAQLARWHTRLLSAPVDEDSPEVDALLALQEAHGWPAALEALVRHPRGVMY
jgi:hypothetical protein